MWLAPGMSDLITAKLPPPTAHDAIVTGRRYGGGEAAAAGIVHEAVAEDDVLPRAVELAAAQAPKRGENVTALRSRPYRDLLVTLDEGALR